MVLLKSLIKKVLYFYTNLNSQKGNELKENQMLQCVPLEKSFKTKIRISGKITQVEDSVADQYYNSRGYDSRIGTWHLNKVKN